MTIHRKPHQHSNPLSLTLLPPLLTFLSTVNANTEKVIFTAPPPVSLEPFFSSALKYNNLPVLGPSTGWSIRTNLTRIFPLDNDDDGDRGDERRGYPSWLVLERLTPGQRYELRVCWSALEPTDFTLDIYPLSTILSSPHLLQSVSQHPPSVPASNQHQPRQNHPSPGETSILLLRVLAAADYFSHHQSLMTDPPPVLVDLILDPYVYNVLPQSLVPTVGYVIVVTVASWFVARWAAKALSVIAGADDKDKKQN